MFPDWGGGGGGGGGGGHTDKWFQYTPTPFNLTL